MTTPLVGVIMGSDSDLSVVQAAVDVLTEYVVPHEVRVVSAHRTPDVMYEYARTAVDRGLRVIIAAAGGAAHLPGMVASMTSLPVIGVPVPLSRLDGLTIAVSENKYITQIARRTVLSEDALSVLVPVLEEVLGWDSARIRFFFESNGFSLREWSKARTDTITLGPAAVAVEAAAA